MLEPGGRGGRSLGGGVGPVAGRVVFDHGLPAMEHRSNDLSEANVDKFAAAITP